MLSSVPLATLAILVISQTPPAPPQATDLRVPTSAEHVKPLEVGTPAPNPMLRDTSGQEISLHQITADKPTVLVFYRGGWCPYCNTHLAELGRVSGSLTELGYQIIAVTPDTPAELNKSIESLELGYTLLSDSDVNAARAFQVAFKVDADTVHLYKNQYNIDLERSSGRDHHILPVPAVFLIDSNNVIRYVHSNPEYRERLSGQELLQAAIRTKAD